jgi:hypothetical protein
MTDGKPTMTTRDTMLKRARSAITGRFVSLAHALRHPKTTVIEQRKKEP